MTNRLMTSVRRCLLALGAALLGLLVAMSPASAAEEAAAAAGQVSAVWKPQQINFYMHTITSVYACRALEDKVRQLLLELGADKGVTVRSVGCYGSELSRSPYLRIKLASPVEATPQVLAELEKTRSTRELAARVKGERADEITGQFPAQWRKVSLSRGKLGLQEGDCELIDELKRKVLPKLAIRIVKDEVSCMPYSLTMGQPRLEVEALTQTPQPDTAASDQANKS
ncbi:MAG TPA: hypothetical protein VNQ81_14090 [Povalibacter sp.]|nr:hypothetical protein [Povalibacter sp.]